MAADIEAEELARELNVSVGVLLQRADSEIDRVVAEQGLDAARGLTTRVRQRGQVSVLTVSPRLADALRAEAG